MTMFVDDEFRLTPKQDLATKLLGSGARHILLRGGSRSGKTFVLCRAIALRAATKKSTHVILRHRFNHLKMSIIGDTFPKVMRLCYPQLTWRLDKSDWFIEFPNKSRILFGGLDDKDRTEKILGQEHSTIYLNEASQISYSARNKALTRLAQNSGLPLREYVDANPPSQGHWTYKLWHKGVEPTSGVKLSNAELYATLQMNPIDNMDNLQDDYLKILDSLPEKERRRFRDGEYLPQVEGALWTYDLLDACREEPIFDDMEQVNRVAARMKRIVVAVDPSGCSGEEDERSDEVGIVVTANDPHQQAHVLEDLSGRYAPEMWAKVALYAYDKWNADVIVAERNFGGAMVEGTIRSVRRGAPVKLVTASRGKTVRAEPIASLYSQGRVKHHGIFPDMEEQMCNFSTAGYFGSRSPDRADAAIWGLTEVMPGKKSYGMMNVA